MSQAQELKERTKQFAIRVVRLFRSLPKTEEARIVGKQALRSGTSVAANYRAVCRARSKAEFVAKIGVVVEEAERRFSGWSCSRKLELSLRLEWMVCSLKQTNC